MFLLFCWYLFVNILSLFTLCSFSSSSFSSKNKGVKGERLHIVICLRLCFASLVWVCVETITGAGIKYCFFSIHLFSHLRKCVCEWLYKVCVSVWVCKNVCVLNNYFTIFFKHDSREKFGLSWALTNRKFFQSGSETGKTSKLLRWVEFTCDFFSLLLLSLSQLWFFYSHFERSRFSDMNENAYFFSVTEAFLTAQFATIFFLLLFIFYTFL